MAALTSVRTETWPILYKEILRVGNPDHSVGVVTLWTERDVIKNALDKKDYCVIGNLYSAAGINHIIRNTFANPHIRHLVMWGADMSASGVALKNFMSNGVDENYQIVGSRGEIEREIPLEKLNLFRNSIQVHDMRGQPIQKVTDLVKSLKRESPFQDQAEVFPVSEKTVTTWPSEQIGFKISSPTVAQTWLKVLNMVTKYGRIKSTRYASTNELKEILNLTAVVTGENPEEEYFPEYMPFTRNELNQYYPEWMTSRKIPGMAYNYGDRFRNYDGLDQIEAMKKLVKERPDSKKIIAFTYKPVWDWENANKGDTPCIITAIGGVQDKKFFLTIHVRSQDMFHGWPRNMFAARKMQKEIADAGGYPMGDLAMITHSAHMYADDWKNAEMILEDWYIKERKHKRGYRFDEDPRGNWLISVDRVNKLIIAKLFTPDMATELAMFHGRSAEDVAYQIGDWELVPMTSHAEIIGIELSKAQLALEHGIEYRQDRPLDFNKQYVSDEPVVVEPQEKVPAERRYVKRGKKNIPIN
jgi:thymidylate synthase